MVPSLVPSACSRAEKHLNFQHYLKIAQGKGYSTDRFVKTKKEKKTNNNAALSYNNPTLSENCSAAMEI